MEQSSYYKAYDGRYRAIHEKNHTWASDIPTPIVPEILKRYQIAKDAPILEVGCGEGRDSISLLKEGYCLSASDVSKEAIRYCRARYPEFCDRFRVIDACRDALPERYAFLFAASVLHMLTEDDDRMAFFAFCKRHLQPGGKCLILSMGDGTVEFCTDAKDAFLLQERTNNVDGIAVTVPATTCRVVNFETLRREAEGAGLCVLESGITASPPDFPSLLYLVAEA